MPNPKIEVKIFHDMKVSAVTASKPGVHFRFEKNDQMGVNLGTILFRIPENSPLNFLYICWGQSNKYKANLSIIFVEGSFFMQINVISPCVG